MHAQNAIDLRTCLRQHSSYRPFFLLAIFPFGKGVWEILVNRKYADQLKTCAEAHECVIEEECHPGMPTEQPSSIGDRFESYMRAQERLIARAVFAQLIAREGQDLEA